MSDLDQKIKVEHVEEVVFTFENNYLEISILNYCYLPRNSVQTTAAVAANISSRLAFVNTESARETNAVYSRIIPKHAGKLVMK